MRKAVDKKTPQFKHQAILEPFFTRAVKIVKDIINPKEKTKKRKKK